MQEDFLKRDNGAIFRGEILYKDGKPDGRGIKIYNDESIYEGWFLNGMCHGYGRVITSKNEIYQGEFIED
jgi:hypothetical protein